MRYILLFFLVFSTIGDGLKKASRINKGVQQANQLYRQEKYQPAANLYRYLIDSLHVKDDEIFLNLGHALYQSGEKNQAAKFYQRLRNHNNPRLQSAALNQLGLISFNQTNPEKALYFFKKAIIQNPQNEIARFNYELVQKYMAANPARISPKSSRPKKQVGPEPESSAQTGQTAGETGNPGYQNDINNPGSGPPQQKPREDQPGQTDSPGQENNIKDGQEDQASQGPAGGETKGVSPENNSRNQVPVGKGGNDALLEKERQMQTLRSRLSKTDLTAEKATMLLEAMRQAELQYLQQLPRQPTRRPNNNKPDW